MTDIILDDPLDATAQADWNLARELYLAGQTGDKVCIALGLKPSTFWRRAARENWLRRDAPRSVAPQPIDLAAEVDDLAQAIDKAWRRVCAALDAGHAADAMRWTRVHAVLKADSHDRGRAEDRDAGRAIVAQADAIARVARQVEAGSRAHVQRIEADLKRARLEKVESNSPDSHGPTPTSTALDPDAPGLGRAERRRRQKYLSRAP